MNFFSLSSRMNELGLLPTEKKVFFGQLLGMCDQISFPLGEKSHKHTPALSQATDLSVGLSSASAGSVLQPSPLTLTLRPFSYTYMLSSRPLALQ